MLQVRLNGDVVIESGASIPKTANAVSGPIVLARGEATGHAHVIREDGCATLMETGLGERFLRVTAPATITHDEHKPLVLPPGDYSVRIAQEYDHFAEEARDVAD